MTSGTLTEAELQTPRTARELYAWADGRIEAIGRTPDGKKAVRFREGLCKPLVEEILPIGLLCESFFDRSDDVTITPVIGNQNYDAMVRDERDNPVSFSKIEVTQGHEGEDAHLRMLHLEREGHANALGAVEKTGTKKTGLSVSIENEAKEHGEIVNHQVQLVLAALDRKLGKNYETGTALLVVFDDMIAFRSDADRRTMQQLLASRRSDLLGTFSWVGVIGWSRKCFAFIE